MKVDLLRELAWLFEIEAAEVAARGDFSEADRLSYVADDLHARAEVTAPSSSACSYSSASR